MVRQSDSRPLCLPIHILNLQHMKSKNSYRSLHRPVESCGLYILFIQYILYINFPSDQSTSFSFCPHTQTIHLHLIFTVLMSANNIEYFQDFLQHQRQQMLQRRKKKQQQLRKSNSRKALVQPIIFQELLCEEKITDDEAIEKGQIVNVIGKTLIKDIYKVEVKYLDYKTITMASREEIVAKNIGALLDFYENRLELKDPPKE